MVSGRAQAPVAACGEATKPGLAPNGSLTQQCARLTATSAIEAEQAEGRQWPNEAIDGLPIRIGDFAVLAVPEILVEFDIDVQRKKPNGTVGENKIRTSCVIAAESTDAEQLCKLRC
jgi:hypothetical protein